MSPIALVEPFVPPPTEEDVIWMDSITSLACWSKNVFIRFAKSPACASLSTIPVTMVTFIRLLPFRFRAALVGNCLLLTTG